ncbi:TMEM143 family protein [Bradyrhizobium sp. HKCCYLS1011]|uniref:TMEM143 family protein n=1 Tax=Bradyrhizobium sp. HKCCYLS1011 TaxID=3420733 RepID=UPI003EB69793
MTEPNNDAPTPGPRDRFIPLRKSDILDGLITHFTLDDALAGELRQFAHILGAILHQQYFDELDRLRQTYFYFDPDIGRAAHLSADALDAAYRGLSDEFVRVLTEANFVEIKHEEILRAFTEHALVRVKIKAPLTDYRDVRMFRRGHHRETISIPALFGLRRRSLEIEVYDDVVLMVATRPDVVGAEPRLSLLSARGSASKVRGGAVLFKYFRHIPRWDLEALFPNVRVVMGIRQQLTLGVPALVGGVPILLKLASTLTVLFVVAGFYLGLSGTLHDNDTQQALAALSGLFALGAFILRQWGNFHRQSLIHQKQLTDNIYYRNVNNNSGIFNYLIGEAEEQDWKEALLAYCGLVSAPGELTHDALRTRIEDLLLQRFSLGLSFNVDAALAKLRELRLLTETADAVSVIALPDAIAQLERVWGRLLPSPS